MHLCTDWQAWQAGDSLVGSTGNASIRIKRGEDVCTCMPLVMNTFLLRMFFFFAPTSDRWFASRFVMSTREQKRQQPQLTTVVDQRMPHIGGRYLHIGDLLQLNLRRGSTTLSTSSAPFSHFNKRVGRSVGSGQMPSRLPMHSKRLLAPRVPLFFDPEVSIERAWCEAL